MATEPSPQAQNEFPAPREALIQQLKVGGRLLVPVGPEGEQQLIRFTRKEQRVDKESLGPVAFVPLLGGMA